jgi:hypothetical protein
MTHLSHPATGFLPLVAHHLNTTGRCARVATCAVVLCLAFVAAPAAHAQSIQGLFASDAREQGGRPAGAARRDWRNTLDRQEREGAGGQQRRKMSEEERSSLRQHMRDAARGAYRDDAPRKGRR